MTVNLEDIKKFVAKRQTIHHTKLALMVSEMEDLKNQSRTLRDKLRKALHESERKTNILLDILSRKSLTEFEKEQIHKVKAGGSASGG